MKKPKLKISEKDVILQITDYLDALRVEWFYCPNKGNRYRDDDSYDTSRDPSTPGAPDIVIIFGGRAVLVEAKSSTGKQSPKQIKFQERIERTTGNYPPCGKYIVAKSFEDVEKALEELRGEVILEVRMGALLEAYFNQRRPEEQS